MAEERTAPSRRLLLAAAGATAVARLVRLDAAAAAEATPPVLKAAAATLALVPKAPTAVRAFNGKVPGPLLRLPLGGTLDVRLENGLDRAMTLSWRGVRLPEPIGGVAGLGQAAVKPGGSFRYRFTPPDPGLFWYRSGSLPTGPSPMDCGLYGALIVDEPSPPPVDADLLLILDEWRLGEDGQIAGDGAEDPRGRPEPARLGLPTANSHPLPLAEIVRPGARVRLRLLNACRARLAVVACTGMSATVIAVDGQPSGLFEPGRGTVPIGPGSRFELMLDLPRQPATAEPLVKLQMEGLPEQPLLRFLARGEPLSPRGAVTALPANPLLPTRIALESSLKRDLVISDAKPGVAPAMHGAASAKAGAAKAGAAKPAAAKPAAASPGVIGWTLGGREVEGIAGKPLFAVKPGAAVTLAFANRTAAALQAYVHGHAFRVLHDLDDGWDPYWRDTVLVGPGRTKHVAFVADRAGRWMVEAVALDRPGPSLATAFQVEA